jgi:hypothetical protein
MCSFEIECAIHYNVSAPYIKFYSLSIKCNIEHYMKKAEPTRTAPTQNVFPATQQMPNVEGLSLLCYPPCSKCYDYS